MCRDGYYYYYGYRVRESYHTEVALTMIILILGIVEFAIGIWVAVCTCLMNPCRTCCYRTPPQQVILSKVINR